MTILSSEIAGSFLGQGLRFGVVAARFNETIVHQLLGGATDCLIRHGVVASDITVVRVPGAFEIPGALFELGQRGGVDGLVALGAVIRGETPHFDFICSACASGCQNVSQQLRLPVAFGILTCDTTEQAAARSGGKAGNKGAEAALAALEMVDVYRQLKS
jgi:6,7-dimethyl-8-ribityllumazine synthase